MLVSRIPSGLLLLVLFVFTSAPAAARDLMLLGVRSGPERSPDPYEPDGIIPEGPFKGRRVDTTRFRSARIVPTLAPAGSPAAGGMLVANFLHQDTWWLAEVPAGAVADVIVQRQDIPGGLGHGQIRFRMKPGRPVRLRPQVGQSRGDEVLVSDTVLSIDGTPPIGVDGPRKPGGLEQYVIAYLWMSLEQKKRIMGSDTRRVQQYRLDIGDADKQSVLRAGLARGTRYGMTRMFSLRGQNCTSEMLAVLDAALTYEHVHNLIGRINVVGVPAWIELYLRQRGLLKPGVAIADLADDPTAR
jgi:hypothetical protein